jgi:hypothetical protein
MSIPRLLKRLSRKSLRDEAEPGYGEQVPPLPPPKSAKSAHFFPTPAPYSRTPPNSAGPYPWVTHQSYRSDPELPLREVPPVVKHSNPYSPRHDSAPTAPKPHHGLSNNLRDGALVVASAAAGVDIVGGMEAIEEGVNTFMEGSQVLMRALSEVAKLHPFIGGNSTASVAFRGKHTHLHISRRHDLPSEFCALFARVNLTPPTGCLGA